MPKIDHVNGFTTRASVKRHLTAQGHKFVGLLAKPESNPKIEKNKKIGVLTAPLHLAPYKDSGFNVCPQASKGCIAACLHTAGNPAYMAQKVLSRRDKTKAYFTERGPFMALLVMEIAALERKAVALKMTCGVRLNATSDVAWERVPVMVNGVKYPNVMAIFPNVEFYDYTKVTKRALLAASGTGWPINYHITFSKTEDNDSDVAKVLSAGGNVAAVFSLPLIKQFREAWDSDNLAHYGFAHLCDGDSHDFRPVDPTHPNGVIVALKAKGQAKNDKSGFVIHS